MTLTIIPNPTEVMDSATENPMMVAGNTNEVLLKEKHMSLTELEANDALEQKARKDSRHIKNQRILIFTTTAFFLFLIAEIIGALLSGSLSLLGDAGAMSVDIFTYLCNIFAEHLKWKNEKISARTRFMIEVVIPTFSLICLLGVTIYVAVDAINVLTIPRDREHDIDVVYLYGFAVTNAVIDFLSSYIFFRKGDIKNVFYNIDAVSAQGQEKSLSSSKDISIGKTTNLNMISAFTHLSGDSLRTASVLVGAMVSTFAGIPSQICDAWAALAVTISIVFIIVPVAYEIVKACLKYM